MRLIDADKLIEHITNTADLGGWIGEALQQIKQVAIKYINLAPSIDIVRCSECVYCNVQNTKYLYAICERHGIEFKPFEDDTRTHSCSWGERRTDE